MSRAEQYGVDEQQLRRFGVRAVVRDPRRTRSRGRGPSAGASGTRAARAAAALPSTRGRRRRACRPARRSPTLTPASSFSGANTRVPSAITWMLAVQSGGQPVIGIERDAQHGAGQVLGLLAFGLNRLLEVERLRGSGFCPPPPPPPPPGRGRSFRRVALRRAVAIAAYRWTAARRDRAPPSASLPRA